MMKPILAIIKKDVLLELRQLYAINGALLYVVSSAFVCYLVFQQIISVQTWNALYWIIMLFSSINLISKSFMSESKEHFLYYYSLVSPRALIMARIIYNSMMLLLLSLVGYLFFVLFLGNPVKDTSLFLLIVFLGSIGLSGVLTLLSAISSRTGNNFTIMAILSFPLVLPLIMVLIKITSQIIETAFVNWKEVLVLILLNLLFILLSNILFHYLWKE